MDIPMTIVGAEEAETADAVVCLRKADDPGVFQDNLTGLCNDCGAEVVFRPSAPKAPIRICLRCAMERGEGGAA